MSTLDSLIAAEQQLEAANNELTDRQIFETGWRVTDALTNVRAAIHAIKNPMPDSYYEGMDI